MIELGITVGLGSDSANNSSVVEVLRSVYLVAVLYKDGRTSTSMVPAEKALEMATIDGARSVGLESEIGSIEAGKKADIVLFDTRRPEWRTLFNPVNSLVYNADGRSVHTVLVDGRVVVVESEAYLCGRVGTDPEGTGHRLRHALPHGHPLPAVLAHCLNVEASYDNSPRRPRDSGRELHFGPSGV